MLSVQTLRNAWNFLKSQPVSREPSYKITPARMDMLFERDIGDDTPLRKRLVAECTTAAGLIHALPAKTCDERELRYWLSSDLSRIIAVVDSTPDHEPFVLPIEIVTTLARNLGEIKPMIEALKEAQPEMAQALQDFAVKFTRLNRDLSAVPRPAVGMPRGAAFR